MPQLILPFSHPPRQLAQFAGWASSAHPRATNLVFTASLVLALVLVTVFVSLPCGERLHSCGEPLRPGSDPSPPTTARPSPLPISVVPSSLRPAAAPTSSPARPTPMNETTEGGSSTPRPFTIKPLSPMPSLPSAQPSVTRPTLAPPNNHDDPSAAQLEPTAGNDEDPTAAPTGAPSASAAPRPTISATERPTAGSTSEPSVPPASEQPTPRPPTRPHIIMVVIDDMGYADPGFKGSGIRTPTIDQLVASGTHLTNYYVLPACTHTRIALMTGKYPYRSGMYSLVFGQTQKGMNPYDATLANVFRARGYQAHAIGKWHLGHAWYDYLPTFRGFQSFLGCWLNQDHFNHSLKEAYDLRWDSREECGPNCSQTPDARGKYSTYVYTDRAVELIRSIDQSSLDEAAPLFLYLAYQAVHTPLQVPAAYRAPYNSRSDWNDARKIYAGMLTAIDDGIAAIVNALKEQGLWNNTLMVLTTDNGSPGMGQGGSNKPLRGNKFQVFEGAIRADGMIVGPARKTLGIRPGGNARLFHAVDWLPTLAELSDSVVVRSPDASDAYSSDWSDLDGVSQVRALRGGKANRWEVFLGYDYSDTTNTALAFRSGDLKLIRQQDGQYLLYNLSSDIAEDTDLHSKSRFESAMQRMKGRIRSYESTFNSTAPSLGQCASEVAFGTTPWKQPLWIPWCSAELD